MGVQCVTGELRLASSSDNTASVTREGKLELCVNGAWGAICADQFFQLPEAAVACRQLSFSSEG